MHSFALAVCERSALHRMPRLTASQKLHLWVANAGGRKGQRKRSLATAKSWRLETKVGGGNLMEKDEKEEKKEKGP